MLHSALMQAFKGNFQQAMNILSTRPDLVNEQPEGASGCAGSVGALVVPASHIQPWCLCSARSHTYTYIYVHTYRLGAYAVPAVSMQAYV